MKDEKKRTYWAGQVDRWRASGQTMRVYCEQHNLVLGTMSRWSWTLKKPQPDQQALVELRGAGQAGVGVRSNTAPIELVVKGRYLLRLWAGTQPDQLRQVIAVLESQR